MAETHPRLIQILWRLAVLNGFRALHKAVNTKDIIVVHFVKTPAVFGRHHLQRPSLEVLSGFSELLPEKPGDILYIFHQFLRIAENGSIDPLEDIPGHGDQKGIVDMTVAIAFRHCAYVKMP